MLHLFHPLKLIEFPLSIFNWPPHLSFKSYRSLPLWRLQTKGPQKGFAEITATNQNYSLFIHSDKSSTTFQLGNNLQRVCVSFAHKFPVHRNYDYYLHCINNFPPPNHDATAGSASLAVPTHFFWHPFNPDAHEKGWDC